jgi:serine/threonine protein kinase
MRLDATVAFVGAFVAKLVPVMTTIKRQWGGACAISMEKLPGTLRDKLFHSNGYSTYFCYREFDANTKRILSNTIETLRTLHRHKITVGDVKAENFMVDSKTSRIVLVDSGSLWHHASMTTNTFESWTYPVSTPGAAHPGLMRTFFDMLKITSPSPTVLGPSLRWTGQLENRNIDYNLNGVFEGECSKPFEYITLESDHNCVARMIDDMWGFISIVFDVIIGTVFTHVLQIGQFSLLDRANQFSVTSIRRRPYVFAFLYAWALACWSGARPAALGTMDVNLTEEASKIVSCYLNGLSVLYECSDRHQARDKTIVRALLHCIPSVSMHLVKPEYIWSNIEQVVSNIICDGGRDVAVLY